MQTNKLTENRKEGGFTLVELAIVMIIIGLLIGGILKGQELIANAQVTATIAQIKGLDGALSTFRDKYSAVPGDMPNAGVRLRDCTGNCATGAASGTRGDGRINSPALGAIPTLTSEGVVAFTHMAAADLISGVQITSPALVFGSAIPEAKIGGGFWLGFTDNGTATGVTGMRPGHYLVLNGTVAPAGNNNGMTTTQAAQVDRKQDDGDPETGDVQATGTGCVASGIYAESVTTANCSLYIRVQS